ncbi:MAG: DUF1080 domain-containing protein [Planctomycetaceae bacterium]|nr:DUF1080 domain-containing protein [Planctomycetaceae bacterium]
MKLHHLPLALMFCFAATSGFAKGPAYPTAEEAAEKEPGFALQGEYAGEGVGIQVIDLSEGKFRAVKHNGGLPGAGWDKSDKTETEGDAAAIKEIIAGLKKMERKSPTLGAKAPEGAVVLFDGSEETLKSHWKDGASMTDDGLLTQGVTSKDTFGSHQLHVEFRLPYMPHDQGQARGNSGCYVQGRYEVQMLDSFGLKGLDNECGGIYKAAPPSVNMCLPPLSWQTYDIDFTAAKFDADGKKTENARVTVKHNGIVIHDNIELPSGTPGGVGGESPEPGPLFLQNHGDPVRYRNIWAVKK